VTRIQGEKKEANLALDQIWFIVFQKASTFLAKITYWNLLKQTGDIDLYYFFKFDKFQPFFS
jgi:hypothetical protein